MAFSFIMVGLVTITLLSWWWYLLHPESLIVPAEITTKGRRGRNRGKGKNFMFVAQMHDEDVQEEDLILTTAIITMTTTATIETTGPSFTPVENAICEQFTGNPVYYVMCLKLVDTCLKQGKRITLSDRNIPECF